MKDSKLVEEPPDRARGLYPDRESIARDVHLAGRYLAQLNGGETVHAGREALARVAAYAQGTFKQTPEGRYVPGMTRCITSWTQLAETAYNGGFMTVPERLSNLASELADPERLTPERRIQLSNAMQLFKANPRPTIQPKR